MSKNIQVQSKLVSTSTYLVNKFNLNKMYIKIKKKRKAKPIRLYKRENKSNQKKIINIKKMRKKRIKKKNF